MDTKALATGVAGFLLGGLVVSVAATQLEDDPAGSGMTMSQMSDDLEGKSGDAYDEAFLVGMIEHHEGAIEMAERSAGQAKHAEIKELSREIIEAQEAEIERMRQWQQQWGYAGSAQGEDGEHSTH